MNLKTDFRQIRERHLGFLLGSFLTSREHSPDWEYLYSDKLSDPFWNYATLTRSNSKDYEGFIDSSVNFFCEKGRSPSIYLTPLSDSPQLKESLLTRGFREEFCDAWMLWTDTESSTTLSRDEPPRLIERTHSSRFLDTFFEAFSGADPAEPYGALSEEYGEAIGATFTGKSNTKLFRHYLIYSGEQAVGCAILASCTDAAAIYCLGVSPTHRRAGIGSALVTHLLEIAKKDGIDTIFLQTEHESSNQRLFTKLGFSTHYLCRGMVLKR